MDKAKFKALEDQYRSDFEAGQDNQQYLGMDLHKVVFFVSAIISGLFIIGTLVFPDDASRIMTDGRTWAIERFDWLFMVSGNVYVLFCLALVILPVGKIRLGGHDAKAEYSTASWLAMLFASGMGIGLMYWSVAEPVYHYLSPPFGEEGRSVAGADLAMGTTIFHWGLHPWAIYGVVGMAMAFFSFNKGLPMTVRSVFYPLLGERVWGWMGDVIDILATLTTLFGLAASLGMGAQQATSGLNFLFDIPDSLTTQIVLIIGITCIAGISVARGMDGGVKLLSNLNMIMAAVLVIAVLLLGPTAEIFGWIGTTAVEYVANILPLSNFVGRDDTAWQHAWTVFYWAWWIAWAPFVGMFIARISKGRTVREFMLAVLLVPTIITTIWMGVFGGTAIEQAANGIGELANGISSPSLAMFQMFDNLPFTMALSSLAMILVVTFFVTSSDSGSLVIDSITAGGKVDSPVPQRMFWAVAEGLVAAALLVGGGETALGAIQAGAITTGLPFTFVLLAMCLSIALGLINEYKLNRFRGHY